VPQPPLELPYSADATPIELPAPAEVHLPPLDVRTAIEQRMTIRQYSPEALTLEELSFLLWCTQGVKSINDRPATLRTVPSAGARHAYETYLLINRVEGLQPGLYRYVALKHALLPLELNAQVNPRLTEACQMQNQVAHSAVTFFWVCVVERMTWRYPERGYRYLFLDAGHICQNLFLAAEVLHCGVCPIGAFDDDALNSELNLDGVELFVAYAATVGKKTDR